MGIEDALFVLYLIRNKRWFDVVWKQAQLYLQIGDIGDDTFTFRFYYRNDVRDFFSIELGMREYIEKVLDEKTWRAWLSAVTFFAVYYYFAEETLIGQSVFLPKKCDWSEKADKVLKEIVQVRQTRIWDALVVHNAECLAPLLWWNSMVMGDVEEEVISRALSMYKDEIRSKLGVDVDIMRILLSYASPQVTNPIAHLIITSPVFAQYILKVHRKLPVTPADMIVTALRLTTPHKPVGVHIYNVADEILKLWSERNMLQTLKQHIQDITRETILYKSTLPETLSLLVNEYKYLMHVYVNKELILKLPAPEVRFDSIFINSPRLWLTLHTVLTARPLRYEDRL